MVVATVITIVNYNRKTFIVQATDFNNVKNIKGYLPRGYGLDARVNFIKLFVIHRRSEQIS